MRRILILLFLLPLLILPARALDYTAPSAPDDALELMPDESVSFGEDLWFVISSAIKNLEPAVAEGMAVCGSVFAVALLLSILKTMPGKTAQILDLAGVLVISGILLGSARSLIALAADTVTELSEYGKLLLPVMTAALAAQGGITSSTALYTGTAVFDAVLSGGIKSLLVPMVWIFLILAVAAGATGETMLQKLRDSVKWLITWCLKMILYIFTGYISITGVISGTADAAAIKATKLTMSGMVPVVGGILSDASEAVLVGAGVMKNAAGVYGLLAILAMWITPFLRIGVQYLLLKLTAALCAMFDNKAVTGLIGTFSAAMGLLVAMTGTVCVLLLISLVCFMKGVS